MVSRKRCVLEVNRNHQQCQPKPTRLTVERVAKGSLFRKVKERRRSPSYSKGSKVIPAAFFEDLAKKAIEKVPEYLRQKVGYPLPFKGAFI